MTATTNIRPIKEHEQAFVISSWLKSYRSSPFVRLVDNDVYYREQAKLVLSALEGSVTLMAVDPQDDDVIWGFIVFGVNRVEYIYVKHLMRLNGIAKLLWEAADKPAVANCLTHAGESILRKYPTVLSFNPY